VGKEREKCRVSWDSGGEGGGGEVCLSPAARGE